MCIARPDRPAGGRPQRAVPSRALRPADHHGYDGMRPPPNRSLKAARGSSATLPAAASIVPQPSLTVSLICRSTTHAYASGRQRQGAGQPPAVDANGLRRPWQQGREGGRAVGGAVRCHGSSRSGGVGCGCGGDSRPVRPAVRAMYVHAMAFGMYVGWLAGCWGDVASGV